MGHSLLAPPPADPAIARRLLASTAYAPPERAVLAAIVPWTLFDLKITIHNGGDMDVVQCQVVPPELAPHAERLLRSSRAPWFRPDELPPALLDSVRGELARWRSRHGRPIQGASALVRVEHGYRLTFRTKTEQATIELALAPPRIAHEERGPVRKSKGRLLPSLRGLLSGGVAALWPGASGSA